MKRYILFICLLICCRLSGQTVEYLVGEGNSSHHCIPVNCYFNYSLTQQIYTAEELGFGIGIISKIAFYNTSSSACTRTFDVYMINTDKTFFSDNTDWVDVSECDKVYSGTHTFSKNAWSEIILDNDFTYEGENILICIDDNTGSYSSTTYFKTNVVSSYSTLYAYSDYIDYNVSVDYVATRLQENNQIKFTIELQPGVHVFPEEVVLGDIIMGDYWSEKDRSVPVSVRAAQTTITNITCDNDFFILSEIDYNSNPITFNVSYDNNAIVEGEQTANITVTSADFEPVMIPVTATAYNPVQGDVFENPIVIDFAENTAFSNNHDLSNFRDDYILPNEDNDGNNPDVVYSFTLEEESIIIARLTGTNNHIAIYNFEDLENNGPSNYNNYNYDWNVQTNEIQLPAGSYYLIASAEDSLSVDINLKYAPTVVVNVVAINNASVAGASVSLVNVNDSDILYETLLDESGHYQCVNVAEGLYELTIALDGYNSCYTGEIVEITEDTTIECTLSVKHEISFEIPEMGSDLTYHFWFDEDYSNVQKGSLNNGVFLLDVSDLPDGIHTLNIMLEGSMHSAPQSFTFAKSPSYNLNVYYQGGLGEVTGSGIYSDSSYVEIEAIPYQGYHFVQWNDSITDNPRTVQVLQDTTFTAQFMINQYNVVVAVQDSTMGTVGGSGVYNYNDNVSIIANSNENHTFLYWLEADTLVSRDSIYNFNIKKDRHFTAVFCVGNMQTTALAQGWNWYSTYLDVSGGDGYDLLTNGLGDNAVILKSQTQFTTYYDEYNLWDGSLNTVDNENLYMIKMSNSHDLKIIGDVSDASNINLTLNRGWNWISYPINAVQDLNESLSGLEARTGDYFKSQTDYAMYYEGYGWDGSLYVLEPGKGYMYKNTDTITKTLTYSKSYRKEALVKNITTEDNHWQADINKYPNNMNITAVVSLDGVEQMSEGYEIAAFVNGDCRGSAEAVYNEMFDRYVFFLTVYGEMEENIRFRLYDLSHDVEYSESSETIQFSVDATVGNIKDPFVINYAMDDIDENNMAETVNIYPNPIAAEEVAYLNKKYEKVEVINSLGMILQSHYNTNKIEGIMIPGIYIIRTFDGKIITNNKLIVK